MATLVRLSHSDFGAVVSPEPARLAVCGRPIERRRRGSDGPLGRGGRRLPWGRRLSDRHLPYTAAFASQVIGQVLDDAPDVSIPAPPRSPYVGDRFGLRPIDIA